MSHDQILEIINYQAPFGVSLNQFDKAMVHIGNLTFIRFRNILGMSYWYLSGIDINVKRNSEVHKRIEELYFECFKHKPTNNP